MNELMPSLVSTLNADVDAICLPEGRMVGSPGHRIVRGRLARRLREIGCEPWRGSFEHAYGGESFCNLIGVIKGRNPRLATILVGAHYDSVIATPCADDNAAAVAIALPVGKRVAESQALERDLVVALFDAEEPPYFCSPEIRSMRFWENQRDGRPVHAPLIMDLVGHDVGIDSLAPGPMASLNQSLAPRPVASLGGPGPRRFVRCSSDSFGYLSRTTATQGKKPRSAKGIAHTLIKWRLGYVLSFSPITR